MSEVNNGLNEKLDYSENKKDLKPGKEIAQTRTHGVVTAFPASTQVPAWQSSQKKTSIKSNERQSSIRRLNKIKTEKIEAYDFLRQIKQAFRIKDISDSNYVENRINGKNYTLRLSNHCVNSYYSDKKSYEISIVIELSKHDFVSHKDRLVKEYVYYPENLTKEVKDNIIKGLTDWVNTGTYSYDQADKINMTDDMKELEIRKAERAQFVQNKLSEAGIEVVTDKNEFDAIISEKADGKKMTQGSKIYGFSYQGKIYLNSEIATSETPLHEYTHLWDNYIQNTNPELWEKGKNILRNTKFWEEVKADPNYAEIAEDEDLLLSEVHAQICGKMADAILAKIQEQDGELTKNTVIDWNNETWTYIVQEFGLENLWNNETKETLENLKEFLSRPMKDLFENTEKLNINVPRLSETERQQQAVREMYHDTEMWLKAPNGKPTNLTEEQWIAVRTPNFKRWFGNWDYDENKKITVVDMTNIDLTSQGINIKEISQLKEWLSENLIGRTIINDDSQIPTYFSNKGTKDSLKKRGLEQRNAYSILDNMLKNAVYYDFEKGDGQKKHPYIYGQDVYYAAFKFNDGIYSVKIKCDVNSQSFNSTYKDHKVTEIKIADYAAHRLDSEQSKSYSHISATETPIAIQTEAQERTSARKEAYTVTISQLTGGVKPVFSKVIDENGEPLVVYHSTSESFDTFKGDVFHFGTKAQAELRAEDFRNYLDDEINTRRKIIEKAANRTDVFNASIALEEAEKKRKKFENPNMLGVFLNIRNIKREYDEGGNWSEKAEQSKLKKYDGLVYYNNYENDGNDSYAVFKPNQIKSATDNNGNFDLKNDSILFQIIGEKGAAELDKTEEATTRLDNLKIAQKMTESGKDAKTIRLATGWERSTDGNWRYEIDDSKVNFYEEDRFPKRHLVDDEEFKKIDKAIKESGYDFEKINIQDKQYRESYIDSENEYVRQFIDFENGKEVWKKTADLERVLNAPELFKAYPELRHTQFKIEKLPSGTSGEYRTDTNTIVLDESAGKSVLLHEIQHAIQYIEGFATGGNEAQFKAINTEELKNKQTEINKKIVELEIKYFSTEEWLELDKKLSKLSGEEYKNAKREAVVNQIENLFANKEDSTEYKNLCVELDSLNDRMEEIKENALDGQVEIDGNLYANEYEAYRSLSGEVEARNVQTRMNMTMEERLNTPLLETADVAPEDQIVMFDRTVAAAEIFEPKGVEKFSEQIDAWQNRQLERGSVVHIGKTSPVLEAVGVPNFEVIIAQDTLNKITRDENIYFAGSYGKGLSIEQVKKIPELLANPVMVFKSASQAGAFVLVSNDTDSKNRTIVAAIHTDKYYKRMVVNEIAGMYGKDSDSWFLKQIDEGRLVYIDKKRSLDWAAERGLQLSPTATNPNFNKNLITKDDFVNNLAQNTTKTGEEKTMEKTTEKKSIDVNTYRFGSGETIDEILSNQSTWKNDSDCLKNMIESNLNAVSDFANEKEQTLLKQLRNIMEQPETDLKELAVITDVATTYMAVKHFDQRLMDEGKRPYSKDIINVQAQKEFSYELPSWLKSSLEEFPNVDRMPSTEGTTEAEIDLDTITNEKNYIRGVKITHEVPEGWRKAERVQTTPLGYFAITNGKSLWPNDGEEKREIMFIKEDDFRKWEENINSLTQELPANIQGIPVYSHSLYYGDSVNGKNYSENLKSALLVGKAKRGNIDAAIELINTSINPDIIREIYDKYSDAIVCAVDGLEANGHNMIPIAYRNFLAVQGFEIDKNITQSAKAHHTGADNLDKLLNRVSFQGKIQKNRNYILLDDHIALGGTIQDLKEYIEKNGGKVVAVTTLTAPEENYKLSISNENFEKLSKYGKTLENLLREYNIAENFSKLTDKEAIEIYDILSDKKKYSGTNSVRRKFLQKISEIKQNQLKEAENERRKEQTDRISEDKSINTDGYTGILPDGKRVTAVEERNGRSNRIHEGQIQEDNLNSSKDLYNSQSNSLSPVEYLTQKINGSGITLHLSKEEMKAILDAGNDVQKMSVKFGTNQDVQVQEEASFGGYGTYVVSVLEENARQLGINIAARKYGGTFYINNQTLGDFLKSKNFSSFWNERLKQVKTNSVDYLSQEILRADVKGNSQLEKEQATLTSLFSLDLIEYKREQTFLYSVNIPDNSGTNYLMYNNPIGLENAERINAELSKLGVEWRASRNDIGKNIYFDLLGKNVFGGNQKQTSEFLINTGYVGLQMDNANYIIFNDKDMSITDRVQYMKDKDGEVYGFAYEGQIYVDKDLVNSNVLAHEYTHIWDSYIQKNNPQLWQTGKNILKGTSLWVEVTEDKNYENLKTDDEILSEIHARITGKFAEQVLEKIAKNDGELTKDRVIDWESEAEQFIARELLIKPELGEENYTSDSVKAAYLKAFLSMPMKDLMNEVKLQVMQNEEIQQMTVRNRPDYMKTPFGQPSELSEKEWYMAHSRDFKEQYGDWEAEVKKNFLLSDNVVSTITGNEFQKDENISFFEQINQFYNSFGNNVESPLFGAVTLDEAGVDDSFAHGMSRIKAAAYASVGDVIKNGVIIDSDINHKGRGYNTYVVAAPIKINKDNYICEVVLKQNKNGYSFYLHEVTEQKKYLGEAFVTHLPQRAASQGTMSTEEAFITSLPQKAASQRTLATLLQNTVSVNQTISCPMSKNMEPEKEFVQKTILEKLQKQVINEVKTDVSLEEAISKAKISHEDVNVYGTPGGTVTLDFSNEPEAFKALTGENPEPYIKYDDNSQFHAEINLKILKDGSLYADVVLPSLINKTTNLSNLEDILKRNDKNFSDEIKNILQEKFNEITGVKAGFNLKSEQIDDPVIKKLDVQPWMFKQETIEDAKRKEELENSKAVSSETEQKKSEESKKKTPQKIDYIKKGAMDFLKAVENGTAPFLDKSIVDFGKITIEPREILNAQTGRAFSGQNQLLSQIYAKEQEMQSLIVTSMEGAKKAGTYIAKKDEAKKNYVLAFQKDQKLFHSRFFEPGAAENPNLIYSKFLEKQRPLKLKSLRECVVHYSRSAGDYDIANKYYQEIAKEHLKNIQAYIAVPDGKKPTIKDLEASRELLKNYFEFENVPEKERTFFEETYGILIDVEKERPVESFSAQSIETEIKKQQDFLMKNTFTETELGEYRKKEFEETVEQMQKEEKEQIDAREITEPEAYLGRYLAACSSNSEFVTDEKTIETVSKKLSENLKRNFQVENYEIIEEIGSQAAKIASEMVNKMSFDKAHSNDVKQAVKQDNDIKHPPVGMGGK